MEVRSRPDGNLSVTEVERPEEDAEAEAEAAMADPWRKQGVNEL